MTISQNHERVARNVWERMIRRRKKRKTMRNVCRTYAERIGTYDDFTKSREGCTERMGTYTNHTFFLKTLEKRIETQPERIGT